jgi:hypothetical protein
VLEQLVLVQAFHMLGGGLNFSRRHPNAEQERFVRLEIDGPPVARELSTLASYRAPAISPVFVLPPCKERLPYPGCGVPLPVGALQLPPLFFLAPQTFG